jgi:hypothetical protein
MANEDDQVPPSAERVARRLIVLTACAVRGCMDHGEIDDVTRADHERLPQWLEALGLREECETGEWNAITTPLGELAKQTMINLVWRVEGAVSLLWALRKIELPPYDNYIRRDSICPRIVFNEEAQRLLNEPKLRTQAELEHMADLYLMLHWRLREYHLRPQPLDFVTFARNCEWAMMPIEAVEVINDDLALRGQPISAVSSDIFHECLSCAQERHHAANWLLGQDPVYSEVTADT